MGLINGKCYDWNSITINLSGADNIEPTSITYGDKQDHEGIYGKKGKYRGYGTGNKTNTVSLEMSREDFNELQSVYKAKGYNDFYDIIVPKITVSYADTGKPTTTDVLTDIKFGSRDGGSKQGDKSTTIKLEGVAYGGIKWNGMN